MTEHSTAGASQSRRRRLVVPLVAVGSAAAIAISLAVLPGITFRSAAPATSQPPIVVSGFVGTWAVTAPGEPAATRLRVQMGELQVWRTCGTVEASWKATTGGAFLTSFSFWTGACYPDATAGPQSDPAIAWINQAHALRSTAKGWELLGADGVPLAALTPGSRPTVPSTMAESEADPPTLTDAQRAALDAPVPAVPPGVSPLTEQALIGTWIPSDGSPGFVTLSGNGTYVGNDGCNDARGTWAVDRAGHLLVATKIFVTVEACAGKGVDRELSYAAAVGLDGATLVGYASDGTAIDRLVHGTPVPGVPR